MSWGTWFKLSSGQWSSRVATTAPESSGSGFGDVPSSQTNCGGTTQAENRSAFGAALKSSGVTHPDGPPPGQGSKTPQSQAAKGSKFGEDVPPPTRNQPNSSARFKLGEDVPPPACLGRLPSSAGFPASAKGSQFGVDVPPSKHGIGRKVLSIAPPTADPLKKVDLGEDGPLPQKPLKSSTRLGEDIPPFDFIRASPLKLGEDAPLVAVVRKSSTIQSNAEPARLAQEKLPSSDLAQSRPTSGLENSPNTDVKTASFASGTGFGATSDFGSASGFGITSGFGNASGFGSGNSFGGIHSSSDHPKDPNACHNYGQVGHRKADCKEPPKPPGGTCFSCGEDGHLGKECTKERKPRDSPADSKCFNCGETGHISKECSQERKPSARSPADENTECFTCKEKGHYSSDYPKAADTPRPPLYIPAVVTADSLFDTEVREHVGSHFEDFYKMDISISRGGKEIPHRLMESFAQLGLSEQVLANIERMKYSRPLPVQRATSIYLNDGNDMMACAQTGSGKTAAFLLPILGRILSEKVEPSFTVSQAMPACIIVEPTRELAIQTYGAARMYAYKTPISICVAYGGTSRREQLSEMLRGCDVLVATMGRLLDFVGKGDVSLKKTKCVVLDEADRMLNEGFKPDIERLLSPPFWPSHVAATTTRQMIMFSATFPASVQTLARDFLKPDHVFVTVDKIGSANKCVKQLFVDAQLDEKRNILLDMFGIDKEQLVVSKDASVLMEKTLIFMERTMDVLSLAAFLAGAGIPCTSIHFGHTQQDREESLRGLKRGDFAILVATGVVGRGLDVQGINHVIIYDFPQRIEDYVQRIGRTGRIGFEGRSTTLYQKMGLNELACSKELVKLLEEAGQEVPSFVRESAEFATNANEPSAPTTTFTTSAFEAAGSFGGGGGFDTWSEASNKKDTFSKQTSDGVARTQNF